MYASNKDGNSIVVDAQEWEELQALVKRQRVIIEMFMAGVEDMSGFLISSDLQKAYEAAQDTTSMTGASEK